MCVNVTLTWTNIIITLYGFYVACVAEQRSRSTQTCKSHYRSYVLNGWTQRPEAWYWIQISLWKALSNLYCPYWCAMGRFVLHDKTKCVQWWYTYKGEYAYWYYMNQSISIKIYWHNKILYLISIVSEPIYIYIYITKFASLINCLPGWTWLLCLLTYLITFTR